VDQSEIAQDANQHFVDFQIRKCYRYGSESQKLRSVQPRAIGSAADEVDCQIAFKPVDIRFLDGSNVVVVKGFQLR